jgi:hypothetical protein
MRNGEGVKKKGKLAFGYVFLLSAEASRRGLAETKTLFIDAVGISHNTSIIICVAFSIFIDAASVRPMIARELGSST